ncbi:hypothetical protein Q3G72_024270 [Acer saccharum]|nr:hypothetical protein Q3G72_024270 [Acer saccharum]
MSNNTEDPSSAPEPGRWYNITLGSSFKDNHNSDHPPKFCTFRYDFKPASIDTSQPGSLHKSKDNRITVEFQNNQHGKPKAVFEGVSEEYKDNDAVLFFDSETFRLEQLHRAVKRLRHVRLPGDPAAGAASTMSTLVVPAVESHSPHVGTGLKIQPPNTGIIHETVQVEQVNIGNSTSLDAEPEIEKDVEHSSYLPYLSMSPADPKKLESKEHVDIVNDNDDTSETAKRGSASEKEFHNGLNIDINLPVDIDDEIADVDVSDGEADKGPNAAEALRAQVNAEGRKQQSSSSSSSSESESSDTGSGSASGSGSGSVSSSSDSESSYGGSVNSI